MNGLELARAYYEAYGKPLLERDFPELLPFLAVGLCGGGSECFGYDDAVSRDHDFEPGFCLFLPEEALVDRRREFLLERAYAKLPKEFMGVRRQPLAPAGGARHGVLRTADFFTRTVGSPNGALDTDAWLSLPEQALAEATNGEIFSDPWGEVTRIRESLAYFPEDIRLKRLAGQLVLTAQAGPYNYRRCLAHGERGAAQLAAFAFAEGAAAAAFLLARRYRPYYKWRFRALRALPVLSSLAEPLEGLITSGNDEKTAEEKEAVMENICGALCEELCAQGLAPAGERDLGRAAYAVNDCVRDPALRSRHILAGV